LSLTGWYLLEGQAETPRTAPRPIPEPWMQDYGGDARGSAVIHGKGSISCAFRPLDSSACSVGSLFSGWAAPASSLPAPLWTDARLPGKHARTMRTARRGSVIATSAWICTGSGNSAASVMPAARMQGRRTAGAVSAASALRGDADPVRRTRNASLISAWASAA
jgi:hypothetical protein